MNRLASLVLFGLVSALVAGCGAAVDLFVPLAPTNPVTPPGGSLVLEPVTVQLPDPEVIGELFSSRGRHVTVRTGSTDLALAFGHVLADALAQRGLGWRSGSGWDGTAAGLAGYRDATAVITASIEKLWLRKREKIVYTENELSLTVSCRIGLPTTGTVIRRTVTVEHRATAAGRGDIRSLLNEAMAEAARQLVGHLATLIYMESQQ